MEAVTPKSRGRPRAAGTGGNVRGALGLLAERISGVEAAVTRLQQLVEGRGPAPAKEWYTTAELAEALGVSQYTVQARWCAGGRVECEKEPGARKWRIPAAEYARLVRGGSPRAGTDSESRLGGSAAKKPGSRRPEEPQFTGVDDGEADE